MPQISQLPDAEYDVMQIIWNESTPITSVQIDEKLREMKTWHISTVKTLLRRLVARGFLSAQKHGKELFYTPQITQDEYIKAETELFMAKFHKKSLRGLMRAMYSDKKPSDEDIAEIEEWFKEDEE